MYSVCMAAKHRGKGLIENVSAVAQKRGRAAGFHHALFGEPHIGPAGKTVFPVPVALAVAEKNQFMHLTLPGRARGRPLRGIYACQAQRHGLHTRIFRIVGLRAKDKQKSHFSGIRRLPRPLTEENARGA